MSRPLEALDPLLHAYSQVLFAQSRAVGVLLAAATFLDPWVGVHGLIGVLGATGLSWLLRFPAEVRDAGLFGYNALLLGLGMGAILGPGSWSLGLAGLGGVAAALGTAAWRSSSSLPVLTAPFLLLFWSLWGLAAAQGWLVAVATPLVDGFLPRVAQGMGALFFVPRPEAGVLVLLALLLWSRQGAVFAMAGATLGMLVWSGLGQTLQPELLGVNLALVGVALGGVWFVPSWSSLGLASGAGVLGGLLAGALAPWFDRLGLPLLIAPFNLTVWALLLALRQRMVDGSPKAVDFVPGTPEANLETARTRLARFGATYWVRFRAPVLGTWTVTQGEGDGPTHLGPWARAIDLEVTDAHGAFHRGEGTRREDYHCYGLPVLACADGTVAKIIDGVRDNEVGEVELADNWGNVVVLWHAPGLYSLVAHLQPGSLLVAEGQRVRRGDQLGRCGSSGRSPRPHLHFQLQGTALVGAPTLALELHDVVEATAEGPRLRAAWCPRVGDQLGNLVSSEAWARDLGFEPGRTLRFDVDGKQVTLRSELDVYGRRLWRDDDGGFLVYGLEDDLLTIYEVVAPSRSVLHVLAAALPRVPLIDDPLELRWRDHLAPRQHLPLGLRWLWDAVAPFVPWRGLELRYHLERDGLERCVVGASTEGRERVTTRACVRSGVGLTEVSRTVDGVTTRAVRITEEEA